ncbi:phytanoyl-CoA dioxygenase family protein [Sphingopyxis sp. KK2]|uniref:phytanoyl-CoA dioxygenase family protein n=1 Tax=Sphingopyxis sp. KK2 TaxID=1855727 RepID=UPI00097E739F|nr:phytanoyl-CoA dioxygenase family protein [Sphingopyxis sp. KK2]
MTTLTKSAIRSVPSTAPIEDILAIVGEDGCVILKNYLTSDQVRALNADIEPSMQALSVGSKHDEEGIKEFHGANTKRLTDVTRASRTFREEILDHDLYHALGDAIFLKESGTYWLDTSQVIEIGPNSPAQMLHRDLGAWPPFKAMGPSGPEIIVNFIIALTDFTEENGATRVIPGSHKWADFDELGSHEMSVPVEMEAGDAVFFSGKTVHAGGANRTRDVYRRGITIPLVVGYLTPGDALPFLADPALVRDLPERVQRILGFRSQYPVGTFGVWMVNFTELGDFLKN